MNKLRIILLIVIIVISTAIIWAKNTSLDIVAVAPGKVVPSNNVKVLQHLEGGIIEKIKVVEGSIVKKGDVLVKFRQIASKSEVGEIKGRLGFIEAGIITYQSLTSKTKPIYPKYLLENYPEIIQNFYNDYKSKLSLLKSEVNLLKAKITADKKESDFAQQKILESKITLKLFNKQVKISSNLKLKNLTSEISHIDLLRNLQILKTKIIEENRKLESLRSNIFIHKKNIELKQLRFNELITNQIKIYLEEKDKYTQRLDKYKDQLGRKSLISPINGMVKSMNFFTEGGVIQPGENILEIVPNDGKFVVKSKLSISDIGFVKINQKVLIKLSGSHSTMFQPLKGIIKSISPDSINDNKNKPFYQIFIELDNDKFMNKSQEFQILPGLEVDCSIVIAKRNILNNLFAPFKNAIDNSFRENIWFESKLNKTLTNHFISLFTPNKWE